jgi:hypothetical protein
MAKLQPVFFPSVQLPLLFFRRTASKLLVTCFTVANMALFDCVVFRLNTFARFVLPFYHFIFISIFNGVFLSLLDIPAITQLVYRSVDANSFRQTAISALKYMHFPDANFVSSS